MNFRNMTVEISKKTFNYIFNVIEIFFKKNLK